MLGVPCTLTYQAISRSRMQNSSAKRDPTTHRAIPHFTTSSTSRNLEESGCASSSGRLETPRRITSLPGALILRRLMLPAHPPVHVHVQTLHALPRGQLGLVEELHVPDEGRAPLEKPRLAFEDFLDQGLLIAAPGHILAPGILQP